MSQVPPPLMPPMLNYAAPAPRNDLRYIATRQRTIMVCILGYVVAGICQFALPPQLRLIVAFIALGAIITGAVFVFMLSLALYGTAVGILLGILTLIPVVGLLVLLIVNGKATTLLRAHGIRVGLMGADPNQIPAP